jgi:lipopolysaccharide/colanic/teichoic acid biosynthesis glycosyltransferase
LQRLSPLEWDNAGPNLKGNPQGAGTGPDWESLQPRGTYARFGRPLLNILLTLVSLPLVGAVTLPLFLINAARFRSFRRAIFVQDRIGHRTRPFKLYKLRTMDDSHGTEYEAWQEGDEGRVPPFGQFLRRTHLDELPQMLNILQGDMTFVGPRPEMKETHSFACDHVPGFSQRNALLPGITGLAQITSGYAGHDSSMYQRKFEQDETYRRDYSLASDLKILLQTPLWMLRMRGWTHRAASVPAQTSGG